VSVFWSFLLELFKSEQTKRLFGFIAAGGTAGALVGPFITDRIVNQVGISGILFFGAAMLIYLFFSLISAWGVGRLEIRANRGFAAFGGATR